MLIRIVLLVFLSTAVSTGYLFEDVSIKGMVESEGAITLSGVLLSLKSDDQLRTVSLIDGSFHLTNLTGNKKIYPESNLSDIPKISGKDFAFHLLDSKTKVEISIFNASGKNVEKNIYTGLQPGVHSLKILNNRAAAGLYIVRAVIGHNTRMSTNTQTAMTGGNCNLRLFTASPFVPLPNVKFR